MSRLNQNDYDNDYVVQGQDQTFTSARTSGGNLGAGAGSGTNYFHETTGYNQYSSQPSGGYNNNQYDSNQSSGLGSNQYESNQYGSNQYGSNQYGNQSGGLSSGLNSDQYDNQLSGGLNSNQYDSQTSDSYNNNQYGSRPTDTYGDNYDSQYSKPSDTYDSQYTTADSYSSKPSDTYGNNYSYGTAGNTNNDYYLDDDDDNNNRNNFNQQNPSSIKGTMNKVKGGIKEAAGALFGKENWKAEGQQDKMLGEEEIEAHREMKNMNANDQNRHVHAY